MLLRSVFVARMARDSAREGRVGFRIVDWGASWERMAGRAAVEFVVPPPRAMARAHWLAVLIQSFGVEESVEGGR